MGYTDFSSKMKNIICKVLAVVPTKSYLKIMYKIKTGRKLNLKNPATYSEKLNWLKIYDRNPLYTKLADKADVREFVSERIGEEYLIPLLGVWDKFSDIDFNALPDSFVLKCTHDFGSVVLVDDKARMDMNKVQKTINDELGYNFYYRGREWVYKNIKPRIIAEKYMTSGEGRLVDYKFFCFNGKVKYMFIATGRGTDLKFDFYTKEFEHLDVTNGVPNSENPPRKPDQYDEMIDIAERLSQGIPNVRVDLYNIDGKIYFSEMTFYHNGGMVGFEPYDFDIQMGKSFVMNKYNQE